MEYRKIDIDELNTELFANFERRQEVVDCWRRVDGQWVIKADPFVDDWSEEEYGELVGYLKNTINTGGVVLGGFHENVLKGFCSVEGELFGVNLEYLDLSSIHVSNDMRGHGIGRILFSMASDWAREKGAKKIYLSAHSAVETQAFYKSVGCVEAVEYNETHVEMEPFDCQLEYVL